MTPPSAWLRGAPTCALLAVFLSVIGQPAAAFDRAALNRWLALDYALPRYAALAESTAALERSAERFCAAPDAAGLAQLRADFGKAMDAWQSVQHLRFGPITEAERLERLYFWPDKHNTAKRQYSAALAAQDPAAIAAAAAGSGSVALQGLPTLERLLYSADAPLIGEDAGAVYRCKLAVAVAGNVARIARETRQDWGDATSGYARMVLDAGAANASFADPREATGLFANAFLMMLDLIADLKLARPLGLNAGASHPRLAESPHSQRSLDNIRANLASLHALFDGGGPGKPGLSIGLRESAEGREVAAEIDDALQAAIAAASALILPLEQAVADPAERDKLIRLRDAVRNAKRLAAAHLPGALDVAVGFNSLDGD